MKPVATQRVRNFKRVKILPASAPDPVAKPALSKKVVHARMWLSLLCCVLMLLGLFGLNLAQQNHADQTREVQCRKVAMTVPVMQQNEAALNEWIAKANDLQAVMGKLTFGQSKNALTGHEFDNIRFKSNALCRMLFQAPVSNFSGRTHANPVAGAPTEAAPQPGNNAAGAVTKTGTMAAIDPAARSGCGSAEWPALPPEKALQLADLEALSVRVALQMATIKANGETLASNLAASKQEYGKCASAMAQNGGFKEVDATSPKEPGSFANFLFAQDGIGNYCFKLVLGMLFAILIYAIAVLFMCFAQFSFLNGKSIFDVVDEIKKWIGVGAVSALVPMAIAGPAILGAAMASQVAPVGESGPVKTKVGAVSADLKVRLVDAAGQPIGENGMPVKLLPSLDEPKEEPKMEIQVNTVSSPGNGSLIGHGLHQHEPQVLFYPGYLWSSRLEELIGLQQTQINNMSEQTQRQQAEMVAMMALFNYSDGKHAETTNRISEILQHINKTAVVSQGGLCGKN